MQIKISLVSPLVSPIQEFELIVCRRADSEEQALEEDPIQVGVRDGYYRAECYWVCSGGLCELWC